ncbi:MAG: M23 family metallopeptidase [Clostridiales bacterium]|nr:M23 family metallopeptidase [Clostridiales bacterium]
MNSTKQPSKFRRFLRNNAALLLLIFCVLAITAVVLAVTLTRDAAIPDGPVVNNPNDDKPGNSDPSDDRPNPPVKDKVQVFFKSPVAYTGISLEYTDGVKVKCVYKPTLKEYSAHQALDLLAADNASVTAMFDGTVIESDSTYGIGSYVVIDHGDNVIATYASLTNVQVQKGEVVKQGEVIGYASTSARTEFKDGAHLHLEVTVNGEHVDPTPYVEGKIYREYEADA